MKKKLRLKYFTPAPMTYEGWEKYSIPIGNGYAGASIFGGTEVERIQFTTNAFANSLKNGGVSNFAELYITFSHTEVSGYERGLDLSEGIAFSSYTVNETSIKRQAFFSYPDKIFAYNILSKNGKADFVIELKIPYLGARPVEEGGRTGEVTVQENCMVMRGTLTSKDLIFEGRVCVLSDGRVSGCGQKLTVKNSKNTTILFALGTSYRLCSEVFYEGNQKAMGDDPHAEVAGVIKNACSIGYEQLRNRHVSDYSGLMDRVGLDLGGKEDGRSTEQLLAAYQNGEDIPYLEEVYYMYGRHLLISSSRKGTPPSSLQGVWTVHDKSPWGSGFWHNINVQMNYWLAFSSNLTETFSAYVEFWQAYLAQAQRHASDWIVATNPENFEAGDGACGWIIGTSASCYEIEGRHAHQHSGPGTGGMTAKMFWDYYDFTQDPVVLKEITYPALCGMAKFLSKCVRNYDGRYLCSSSASPEQILSGEWVKEHKVQQYYHTVGCAFDQQMIYENAVDYLKCCELLGTFDHTAQIVKAQLVGYVPIQIGYSGQIKEYDEEHFYGEIGEAKHRHISQLVALMPGSQITNQTSAWLDSARLTLELRGDESTGWALAHRFCAWARAGDGNHAYLLLKNLLKNRTHPNLWDVHPPFQIDGNFGAVAGMTEMLLQSHEGYIALLPAIPERWKNITFRGLKARGNFTVSCDYRSGRVERCVIESVVGGPVNIWCGDTSRISVIEKNSRCEVEIKKKDSLVCFDTKQGSTYILSGFGRIQKPKKVQELTGRWAEAGVHLAWTSANKKHAVYRAVANDMNYTLIGETQETQFIDQEFNENKRERLTYKVITFDDRAHCANSPGALCTLHPASQLEVERYALRFKQNNVNIIK